MIDTFVCATHGIEVPTSGNGCPLCWAEWEQRRPADQMTPEERVAELERWGEQLSIPMIAIHPVQYLQRIDELVGRPVYPHEIGLAWDQLREEAWHRSGQSPDPSTIIAARVIFEIVVDLIPAVARLPQPGLAQLLRQLQRILDIHATLRTAGATTASEETGERLR